MTLSFENAMVLLGIFYESIYISFLNQLGFNLEAENGGNSRDF